MNWKEIKEKSKIWNLILKFLNEKQGLNPEYITIKDNRIGYLQTDGVHIVMIFIPLDDRFLYDFFDKQGIIIDIDLATNKGQFGFVIYFDDFKNEFEGNKLFDNNPEAEQQAFLKAFEILEEKFKT